MTSSIDWEARLTTVQTAIQNIEEGAQNVTYNGRSVGYADLKTLYDREQQIISKIERSARGGIRVRRGTPL